MNISIMAFHGGWWHWWGRGGAVLFHSENIATGLDRAIFAVDNIFPTGESPLSTSFHEAFRYFSGSEWPSIGLTAPGSVKNGYYVSPITHQCQKNSIVIFTDGDPFDDGEGTWEIGKLVRNLSLPDGLDFYCEAHDGGCLDEFAWYLANHDVNQDFPGKQTISTYTIGGFGLEQDSFFRLFNWGRPSTEEMLISAARHGGGKYYEASEVDELHLAFKDSLARVSARDSTFVAPATSVSAVNSFETAEDVYFTVFKPGPGAGWTGNLKRYRLGRDNKLYDANGRPAVDPATGYFADNAKSFWSSSVDGKKVGSGGMAEKLSQDRPVYSNMRSGFMVNLAEPVNRLHERDAFDATMFEAADQSEAWWISRWARGVDVDDHDLDGDGSEDRASIGDPIHTQPQVVTYFKNSSGSVVDKSVFFTTNDGFLHSVDADSGKTEFSFIPEALLPNLKLYRDALAARNSGKKVYGMDGPMTVWIRDANGDGDVLSSNNGRPDASNEYVNLYLTMRRGGNNIYALDVTERDRPYLKWVIRGGNTTNRWSVPSGDFRRLGQTWSAAKVAQVKWNGRLRHVLLFGGGYDEAVDGHITTSNVSSIGNAVFMVDADSGVLLWRASNNSSNLNIPDMRHSIPASLTPLDLDGDGAVDVIFGGDTGGQIFRIDINQSNSGAGNFATGGVIARLSGNSTVDARRFFEPVAVSLGRGNSYLNIAVGSGYRPSPLGTSVNDRMYVIKDPHVTSKPSNYGYVGGRPITEANLYDATSNLLQQGNSGQRSAALSKLTNARGWYMKLEEDGEKVLSKAVIHNGVLLFNTFAPIENAPATCYPVAGHNFVYAVNIDNGEAVSNLNSSGGSTLVKSDRRTAIKSLSIAPSPTVISRANGGANVCVGTTCFQNTLGDVGTSPVIRRFWRENR